MGRFPPLKPIVRKSTKRGHVAWLAQYDREGGMVCTKTTRRSPAHAFDKRGERLEHLSRYERAIENSLFRALHELQRLQAARQGAPVPVPVMLDVAMAMESNRG